ncbi:hypothetical protein UO65_0600 [Actinokineospora spheciospongiae]|uniref:Uncharacterized protein n=1 Tax=Actinokineospora spheciospongiae TaxID=909613 RepID=W7IUQ5_9PSEU|nr:hypothetical protein UO65_0600 [Actinokineospora spheciospongiae]PWW58378.1 hypothetical protein DFQ13_109171 [Actinokineospora spheciospongiae]
MKSLHRVLILAPPTATIGSPGPPAHTCPIKPPPPAASAARCRRHHARALATRDPHLARRLGIGRPDLGLDYDDGGLVELGGAPAATIARICGLTRTEADRIVTTRATSRDLDELLVAADVPVSQWGMVRDRALLHPQNPPPPDDRPL